MIHIQVFMLYNKQFYTLSHLSSYNFLLVSIENIRNENKGFPIVVAEGPINDGLR